MVCHLVLDLEAVTDIDVTGAESFRALKQWLADQDIALSHSRPRAPIIDRMRTLGLYEDELLYETNRAALRALVAPLGTEDTGRQR